MDYLFLFHFSDKPLELWDKKVTNGHIKRLSDNDIHSPVLEIVGANITTCYISSPPSSVESLGIKLPYFVLLVKNV